MGEEKIVMGSYKNGSSKVQMDKLGSVSVYFNCLLDKLFYFVIFIIGFLQHYMFFYLILKLTPCPYVLLILLFVLFFVMHKICIHAYTKIRFCIKKKRIEICITNFFYITLFLKLNIFYDISNIVYYNLVH